MSDPFNISEHARRLLVEELMFLTGADALNAVQHRKELESLTLPELGRMRAQLFEDLDRKFSATF